jgi:formylglycine-generating enzyme required for sulfatase activity
MSKLKHPLKVFLCHAHADRSAVRALYTRLTNDGVDVWLDKEKLLPGQDWELEIKKAVRETDVVVVCLSKQFNQAGFRQREVRLALDTAMEQPEGEIFIIPARLEECDNLESLRKWHWVDLFEDDGYYMLVRALRARADNIGATLQIKKGWLPKIKTPIETTAKLPRPVENVPQIYQFVPNSEKEFQVPKKFNRNLIGLFGLIVLSISSFFGLPFVLDTPTEETRAINTESVEFTETQIPKPSVTLSIPASTKTPAFTITPAFMIIPAFTITPTPLPSEVVDIKGVTMRLVPAGEFIMGHEDWGQFVHQVYLDAFFMDKYEVTNFLYSVCVDEGVCLAPSKYAYHYNNSDYKNHPVVYVNWDQAKTYCNWRGGDLPTEAQWEKAARGTDGRSFPWRDGEVIGCDKANYLGGVNRGNGCVGNTTKVGIYEFGKSPYGIYDLAGNVMEWTADWYLDSYYLISPYSNPQGPESGTFRVLRGGAWNYNDDHVSSVARNFSYPDWGDKDRGFRCVSEVIP